MFRLTNSVVEAILGFEVVLTTRSKFDLSQEQKDSLSAAGFKPQYPDAWVKPCSDIDQIRECSRKINDVVPQAALYLQLAVHNAELHAPRLEYYRWAGQVYVSVPETLRAYAGDNKYIVADNVSEISAALDEIRKKAARA